jgi:hypothetical protein
LRNEQKRFNENRLELKREVQANTEQDELHNYNSYTEESGDYNNNPNFSTDPYDESN